MDLEKQWVKSSGLVGLPGLPGTHRNINRMINRQGLPTRPHKGRGGGREVDIHSLPEITQKHFLLKHYLNPVEERLAVSKKKEQLKSEELWKLYGSKPNRVKEVAKERLHIVLAVHTLISRGDKKGAAKTAVSAVTGKSVMTIDNWLNRVKGVHRSDWLPALLPDHQGCQVEAYIHPQAWAVFKSDYLRVEKPTAQSVYDRLCRIAAHNKWGDLPSLKTFLRKLKREICRPILILAREGEEALNRSYPAQERDRSVFHALQAVNADGHKFDVFVKFPDGEVCRPVMVAFQDLYSGKILSWRVTKSENTDTIRLAFGDILEGFGIPEEAYFDNGRGFASKWLTGGLPNRYRFKIKAEDPIGILLRFDIKVHFTKIYNGQSKPIERSFRDFGDRVSKHPAFEGAYTGNKPDAKPENYGDKAIPLDVFLKVLEQEIMHDNARQGRRSKVCNGRSFDAVFNESYTKSVIKKATEEQRRLWLLAAESVTASRQDGSITFMHNRYYCDELAQYAGSKVVARFDPDNLHGNVFVETLEGHFIGKAECVQAAGFNDSQAAREHNRKRNQYKKAVKKQLEAERSMTAIEVANFLPDIEPPEMPVLKVVQPQFKMAVGSDITPDEFQEYFRKGLNILKGSK